MTKKAGRAGSREKEKTAVETQKKVLTAKVVIVVGISLVALGMAIVIGLRWDVFTKILETISEFLIEQPCCLGAIVSCLGIIVAAMGLWYYLIVRKPEQRPWAEQGGKAKKKARSEQK